MGNQIALSKLIITTIAGIVGYVFLGEVAAASVIDELNDQTGWEILPRNPSYGKVEFSNGAIAILRHPTATMHDVAVQKTYRFQFPYNTWIHVLVRQPERTLIGADMYTSIYLNEKKMAEFNVNGEEHWFNKNGRCTAKELDDSFHIGLAADNREYLVNEHNGFQWTNDVPVSYPPHVQIPYSKWTLYSVKYHVPEDGVPRWKFYVDGREIVYRNIGYVVPEGQFQNVATVKPRDGNNDVSLRLTVLGAGELYKRGKGYAGAEQRQCFSDTAPFSMDTDQVARPGTARVEWDFVIIGNARNGNLDVNTIKSIIYAGRVSTATAVLTDLITWNDAQLNCPYVSHEEIRRVRTRKAAQASDFCLDRVKSDIYAGSIGTADAILTDLISWERAQFNCQYMSENEKTRARESPKGSPRFCMQ